MLSSLRITLRESRREKSLSRGAVCCCSRLIQHPISVRSTSNHGSGYWSRDTDDQKASAGHRESRRNTKESLGRNTKESSGNGSSNHEGFVNKKWSESSLSSGIHQVSESCPMRVTCNNLNNTSHLHLKSLLRSSTSKRLLYLSHSSSSKVIQDDSSPLTSPPFEGRNKSSLLLFNPQASSVNKPRSRALYCDLNQPLLKPSGVSKSNHSTIRMSCTSGSNGSMSPFTITLDNMNPNVKQMEYAVRGPLVIRAGELEKELREGGKKPFSEVIRANIGDCHAMGQVPITFIRQVLACVSDPGLIQSSNYPSDVKERARVLLQATGAGMSAGCYSDSAGVELIRRDCARFITERDGIEAKYEDIVLTTGASEAVRAVLALINSKSTVNGNHAVPSGVMIPIPQYPLYTATLAEYGMHPIPYYLDEANQWSLDMKELERALNEHKDSCTPKAIVVINPGNPTGSVLTRQNIEDIIRFARKENLMIMADEVYQHNVYKEGAAFHSFKKVMTDLGIKLELASMMSASKGYMGECGLRGGYAEVINLDPDVKTMFLKMLSARLCSSVLGQMALDCIVNPPRKGDPSYELHEEEKHAVLHSLKSRARLVADTFNSIPGMKSNEVAGAMYAFPQIILPDKAIRAAEEKGQPPDVFYAWQLLETAGICIVPGSGFGQLPGTLHFRTTILPQPQNLARMMDKLKQFHLDFCQKYK